MDRPGAGLAPDLRDRQYSSSAGRFSFKARSGPSRTLRFRYLGTTTTLPRNGDVDVQVRAAVTINTDRRELRNGESLQFSGRLRGEPIPEKGKLLALPGAHVTRLAHVREPTRRPQRPLEPPVPVHDHHRHHTLRVPRPRPARVRVPLRRRHIPGGSSPGAWLTPLDRMRRPLGRVAQWESARFTRERSQVRNPPRPSPRRPATGQNPRPRAGRACRSATRPSRYVAAGPSRGPRRQYFESVAAARSPLMAILWTVAPRCSAAHSRVAPLTPPAGYALHLLAGGPAHVVGAGTRAGGEVPRPVVGGLGDHLPRSRRHAGERHGRDGAAGLVLEPAPPRDVAREAVDHERLVGRPEPGERGLAPRVTRRRGDVRAAGRADPRAADRFVARVGDIGKDLDLRVAVRRGRSACRARRRWRRPPSSAPAQCAAEGAGQRHSCQSRPGPRVRRPPPRRPPRRQAAPRAGGEG